MPKLIYSAIASVDGYVEDGSGGFEWAAPDEEVHAFINELERPIGTYLYGRRMYESMLFWESPEDLEDQPPVVQEYAQIWQAADKVVFSRTLQAVSSARTSLEVGFVPARVRELKGAAPGDMSIGGAELAGQAMSAGLVDECHLFLVPTIVGNGKPALQDGLRARLGLLDERRFGSGVVYLRYRVLD